MTDTLQRVLRATEPLTLAGVPSGFLPWLAADLARAAHGTSKSGRAVIIASDEAAMRALAETVPLFAPEVEVLTLPAWDCLPYDRTSPALRVMHEDWLAPRSRVRNAPSRPRTTTGQWRVLANRLCSPRKGAAFERGCCQARSK